MASLNLNKAILIGRLTADPELKNTPAGVAVTSFTVAVNRRQQKDKAQEADFISCVAWRQSAEFVCRYFRKGNSICVIGSIQTRSWTEQNNTKRYATEVVAEEVRFVDSKSDTGTPVPYVPEAYVNDTSSGEVKVSLEEMAAADDLPF